MPTYTYSDGNKRVTSDEPLTDAELEEAFGEPPKQEGSLAAEALRTGLASGTGIMAGLAGSASELVKGRPLQMVEGFARQYEPVKQGMLDILGTTGVKPKTQSEQILFGGISGLSDPLTYILPGAKYLKEAPAALREGYKAIQGLFGGAGGEAGGIAGEKVAGDTGRVVGSLIGGTGAGMLTGGVPRVAATAIPPAVGKVRSLISKVRGTEPIEAAEQAAQKHIDNIFVAAATADPNFANTIEQAVEAQKRTGISMPLSAMLKDNPVINSYIGHLAARDPEFKKQFYSQFEQAKTALQGKTEKLFGKPVNADALLSGAIARKTEEFGKATQKAAKVTAAAKQNAEQIAAEMEQINPNEFGARVADITEASEKAARQSVAPMYDKAFEIARNKNLNLPYESVADIYNTVVDSKNADIFATFPSIFNKVKSQFRPKTEQASAIINEMGRPLREAQEVFGAATIENLDSLKKEINKQLRSARTDSHIRVLQDLKDKVNTHITSLDPDFVNAYKSADQSYLMKVGLPFNEQTIKSIERAKFDENITPLLTKNKSTVSQFIDATGDQGKKLVEDAFVSDFAKYAIKDGVIDSNKARAWLATKREPLSVIPEVRKNIEQLTTDSNALLDRVKTINSNLDDAAKTRILKSSGLNAQELVGRMYGSKAFTTQFLKQYSNDKDAMNAIRSFMLDDIVKSSKPLDALNDRTRAGVYDSVFGGAYKDRIKQLATVSDRITNDPSAVAINLKNIDADMLTKLVGTSPERFVSLFATNPVVSKPVALMTVINRFFNKKAGEIVERDMKNLLLDKEGSARILHAMSLDKDGALSMERLNSFAKWAGSKGYDFAKMLKDDALAGAKRSYRGMDEEQLGVEEEQ